MLDVSKEWTRVSCKLRWLSVNITKHYLLELFFIFRWHFPEKYIMMLCLFQILLYSQRWTYRTFPDTSGRNHFLCCWRFFCIWLGCGRYCILEIMQVPSTLWIIFIDASAQQVAILLPFLLSWCLDMFLHSRKKVVSRLYSRGTLTTCSASLPATQAIK